jgi:hypothetical protein
MNSGTLAEQLANFIDALSTTFFHPSPQLKEPKNWREAFRILSDNINAALNKKIILFKYESIKNNSIFIILI